MRKPTPAIKFYLHDFNTTVKVNITPSSVTRKVSAKWHWPLKNKAIATYSRIINQRKCVLSTA